MRNCKLTADRIRYFTYNNKYGKGAKSVSVIYLDIKKDQ